VRELALAASRKAEKRPVNRVIEDWKAVPPELLEIRHHLTVKDHGGGLHSGPEKIKEHQHKTQVYQL
jgi:hypothetical protein